MKHTELPWGNHKTIVHLGSRGGFDISNCPDAEANAAFIVKAVNEREELLNLLKLLTYRGSYEGRPSDTEVHNRAVKAIKQAEES